MHYSGKREGREVKRNLVLLVDSVGLGGRWASC